MTPRQFEIDPPLGVAPVMLGMTQAESRAAMDAPYRTYEKVAGSGVFVDACFDSAFQVYFDRTDSRVEYVELSRDAGLQARLRGIDVFATPADALIEQLSQLEPFDPATPDLGYMYHFPEMNVTLWRPTMPEAADDSDGRYFETVGIGGSDSV